MKQDEPEMSLKSLRLGEFSEAVGRLYEKSDLRELPSRLLDCLQQLMPSETVRYEVLGKKDENVDMTLVAMVDGGRWGEVLAEPRKLQTTMGLDQGVVSRVTLLRLKHDFTPEERLMLELLRPHMANAYRMAKEVCRLLKREIHHGSVEEHSCIVTSAGHLLEAHDESRKTLQSLFTRPVENDRELPELLAHQVTRVAGGPMPALLHELKTPMGETVLFNLVGKLDESRLLMRARLFRTRTGRDLISRRESEVLRWVAQGKTNSEISKILQISRRTVDKHVERILNKLGVENRVAAAMFYHSITEEDRPSPGI